MQILVKILSFSLFSTKGLDSDMPAGFDHFFQTSLATRKRGVCVCACVCACVCVVWSCVCACVCVCVRVCDAPLQIVDGEREEQPPDKHSEGDANGDHDEYRCKQSNKRKCYSSVSNSREAVNNERCGPNTNGQFIFICLNRTAYYCIIN